MTLDEWAIKWQIPAAAVADLRLSLASRPVVPGEFKPTSEDGVSKLVRLEASHTGVRLWRNNVGVLMNAEGRPVRFGLANDSPAINRVLKSADLIGIRPVVITPGHVGQTLGQFVSREVKTPGWRYTGTEREQAQMAWAEVITAAGGDACFATGEGTL